MASTSNSRKRSRSMMPPFPQLRSSISVPIDPIETTSTTPSQTVVPSPNPKPRKQAKRHESGVYTGSGFKRRHKRGTSTESIELGDDETFPVSSTSFKSPARKKRPDPDVEDYTPQRDPASTSVTQSAPAKRKTRTRRSATPDVPYEPPTEQFTPPRHIVLHVPSSTTSTRSRKPKPSSSGASHHVERKVIKVKVERLTSPFPLPPIDLSRPVPPPSPTDDPLLLVGPPVVIRRSATPCEAPQRILVDASVGVEEDVIHSPPHEPSTPIRVSPRIDQSQWDFVPNVAEQTALLDVAFDGPSTFDATFDQESDSDGDDTHNDATAFDDPLPTAPVDFDAFDPDVSTGSHIFHSDDEEAEAGANNMSGEDEGEYTGRFKFYNVPVKDDPPSSATRARRQSFGSAFTW
ncbi:hypothetical protein K439DRAFT_1635233 [Ramaria rubella]|nr:hypothetical protein K439DRAFT_1635233 [Ramaria rubella]